MDIIDPPVGPYSSLAELQEWRDHLKTLEPSEAVQAAIQQVERWISRHPEARSAAA